MSSANILIASFSSRPGILSPWIVGSFLILHASGSIARLKIGQDRGSPCLTPHLTLKCELKMLLMATRVSAFWYRDLIV